MKVHLRSLYVTSLLVLAALLATPFYFVTTEGGTVFAPLLAFRPGITTPGFGIPIAMAGVMLLGMTWLPLVVRERVRPSGNRMLILLVVALVGWMTAVAAYGAPSADRPLLVAALFFQTVLPLLVFLAVLSVPLSDLDVECTLLIVPIVGSGSVALLLSVGAYFFALQPPMTAFAYLTEAFYSAKNVHPVVVAIGIAILLWQVSIAAEKRHVGGWKLWSMLSLHAAYLLIIWSRSGMVMLGVIFLSWIAREIHHGFREYGQGRRFWIERGAVVALMLVFGTLGLTKAGLAFRPVFESVTASPTTTPSSDAERHVERGDSTIQGPDDPDLLEADVAEQRFGDRRRLKLMLGGLARVRAAPLTGVGFHPLPPESHVLGRQERSHKLYPSHNQFIDIAVRAGVPAVVLYLILLLTAAVELRRAATSRGRGTSGGELAMLMLFTLAGTALASLFQNYFVVTQPAVMVFLVVGIALAGPQPSGANVVARRGRKSPVPRVR